MRMPLPRTIRSSSTAVALSLLLPACGGVEATGPTTDSARSGAVVAVAGSDLGDILVDGDGRTLYAFLPDDAGDPTCTDGCAQTWPPYEGPAAAGQGVDGSLLATARHPSGLTTVTYGGWPLYHFSGDPVAGDVNGQGVGGNWYVVAPDGRPLEGAAPADDDTGARDGGSGYERY